MTCFFRFLGLGITLVPLVLMLMALPQNDWTVDSQSLVTFDANAVVYEDQVRFNMGPFKADMAAVAGEGEVFDEEGYLWCSQAGFLPDRQEARLCALLRGVQSAGVAAAVMGALGVCLYLVLGFRSMKLKHVVPGAKIETGVHVLQAVLSFLCVGLWALLVATYHDYLATALGPNFAQFPLPYGPSFKRAIAAGVMALVAAVTAHKMGKLSQSMQEKVVVIQRKRSEFELKELEEQARREAEGELKVPDEVV